MGKVRTEDLKKGDRSSSLSRLENLGRSSRLSPSKTYASPVFCGRDQSRRLMVSPFLRSCRPLTPHRYWGVRRAWAYILLTGRGKPLVEKRVTKLL